MPTSSEYLLGDNPDEEIGNAFASKACELLKEFSKRLDQMRAAGIKLQETYHTGRPSTSPEYLRQRYAMLFQEFNTSLPVYQMLIRQSSQWIQHGKASQPHLQLEMEVRLSDFEQKLRIMQGFLALDNMP